VTKNLVTIHFGNCKNIQSPQSTTFEFFWSPNLVATKNFDCPTLWQLKKFNHHKSYGNYGNQYFSVAIES
jgi:hypothetical protein